MLTNDIRDGDQIRLTDNRRGWMRDNKSGITRVVEVEVPGQGTDVGSCYIDEITMVKVNGLWEKAEMLPQHKKKIQRIRYN